MTTISVGIVGYGNLGRGVQAALRQCADMRLAGIFSRRGADSLNAGSDTPVYGMDQLESHRGSIDVMILCGGSKSDLPQQGPQLAAMFNIIDSFDTHAKIPEYFDQVDAAARRNGNLAIISVGWDPGLFSVLRVLGESILPTGNTATFWGKGVSQGHSDAIRRIPGVKNAVQYTIPVDAAVERVRRGDGDGLTTRDKHTRDCYVVLKDGADPAQVEQAIVTMPDYFADYNTTVTFITEQELSTHHSAMPHGGFVIRRATSGGGAAHTMDFGLTLESNPEFTASVLVAYARAAHRLAADKQTGARTVFDIPPGLLSPKSPADLRRELL